MSKHGRNLITICVWVWIMASLLIVPGSLDADTMTVLEAIEVECYLTIGLGIVILAITLLGRGESAVTGNIDKAINCLKMDKLDSRTDDEQLNQAMRYIMRERAERHAKEKEAQRLADRKGSMKNYN